MLKFDPSSVINSLPEEHTAQQMLPILPPLLPVLGRVIIKHGLETTVGMALLHKHYDLAVDEQLQLIFRGQTVQMTPVSARLAVMPLPMSWKVVQFGNGEMVWVPFLNAVVEGAFRAILHQRARRLQAQPDFFEDMASVLLHHQLEGRLGLTLLFDDYFSLKPGEQLLEKTDKPTRLSIIQPSLRVASHLAGIFPTLWRFDKQGQPHVVLDCC